MSMLFADRPDLDAYVAAHTTPVGPLLDDLEAATHASLTSSGDARGPGRRRAAALPRRGPGGAHRPRDRHLQRLLVAGDGVGAARGRAADHLRARRGTRGVRALVVRPLARTAAGSSSASAPRSRRSTRSTGPSTSCSSTPTRRATAAYYDAVVPKLAPSGARRRGQHPAQRRRARPRGRHRPGDRRLQRPCPGRRAHRERRPHACATA